MKWNPDGMSCLFVLLAACVVLALGLVARSETKLAEPPPPPPPCDCRCRCVVEAPCEPAETRPEW